MSFPVLCQSRNSTWDGAGGFGGGGEGGFRVLQEAETSCKLCEWIVQEGNARLREGACSWKEVGSFPEVGGGGGG